MSDCGKCYALMDPGETPNDSSPSLVERLAIHLAMSNRMKIVAYGGKSLAERGSATVHFCVEEIQVVATL